MISSDDWQRIADRAARESRRYRALTDDRALFTMVAAQSDVPAEGMMTGLRTLRGVRDLTADDPGFAERMLQGADRLDEVAKSANARAQLGTRHLGEQMTIPEGAEFVERVRVGNLYQVRVTSEGKTLATATFDNAAEAIRESQRIERELYRGAAVPSTYIPTNTKAAAAQFGINPSEPDDWDRLIETANGRAGDFLNATTKDRDLRRKAQFDEAVETARRLRGHSPEDEAKYAEGMLPKGFGLGGENRFERTDRYAARRTIAQTLQDETADEWYHAISIDPEDQERIREIGNAYNERVLGMAGVTNVELKNLNTQQRNRLIEELAKGEILTTPKGNTSRIDGLSPERRQALIDQLSPDMRRIAQGANADPATALAYEWMAVADEAQKRKEVAQLLKAGLVEPGDVEVLVADNGSRQALLDAMEQIEAEKATARAAAETRAVQAAPQLRTAAEPELLDVTNGPTMFSQSAEDLPLFSGTAPAGEVEQFTPKQIPDVRQSAMPGTGVEEQGTLPAWVRQELDNYNLIADRLGVSDQIEELSAQRLTAKQVAQALNLPQETTDALDVQSMVRAVRSRRGIPSMDQKTEFEAWLAARKGSGLTDSVTAAAKAAADQTPLDMEVVEAMKRLHAAGMSEDEVLDLAEAAHHSAEAKQKILDLAASEGGMFVEEVIQASKLAGQAVEPPTLAEMADVVVQDQKRLLAQLRDGLVNDWDNLQELAGENVLPWVRNRTRKWATSDLTQQWNKTRTIAVESARQMADGALLDYGRKRRADTWLGLVTPYSFWATRSARNWAIRLSQQPGTLASFIRYKQAMNRFQEQRGYRERFEGSIPIPADNVLPDWMGDELFVNPEGLFYPFASMAPNEWERPQDARNGIDYLYRTLNKYGFRPYGFIEAGLKAANVVGDSRLPGENQFWRPIIRTPQGQMAQAARVLARPDEMGPVKGLFGYSYEDFDSYRIDRELASMGADDPSIVVDGFAAQTILERVAAGEITPKEAIEGGANLDRLAQVYHWTDADLHRGQELLRIAWLRSQKEKAIPALTSGLMWTGARVYPRGERQQVQMQREAAAAGYDPLTRTGSREDYLAYMEQHPEAYMRTVANQLVPGRELPTEETWTPLERRGTLLYHDEREQGLTQLNEKQLQALAINGLWDRDSVRTERETYTDEMTQARERLHVGEYAWPEAETVFRPEYGSTPAEATQQAKDVVLGRISESVPRYSDYGSSEKYEEARRAFYQALSAGNFDLAGVTLPDELPQQALDYGQGLTEDDLIAFWQENDTLAEGLVEAFGKWYGDQWDAYRESAGRSLTQDQLSRMSDTARSAYYDRRDRAWQKMVEANGLTPAGLAKELKAIYGDRWSDQEIQEAVKQMNLPTLLDAWLSQKSPEEQAQYHQEQELSDAKEAFWEAYWQLPEDADWRSTKGQPLVALVVDKDTRELATAAQYAAAAAVLKRYIEENGAKKEGADEEGDGKTAAGGKKGQASSGRYTSSRRTYYGGGGGGWSRGGGSSSSGMDSWDKARRKMSGALSRQLADLFLRGKALGSGALREIQALMDAMGWSGTLEEFLAMLQELFKGRAAPTAAPSGRYR
jgi:hypothetical protein